MDILKLFYYNPKYKYNGELLLYLVLFKYSYRRNIDNDVLKELIKMYNFKGALYDESI